MIRELNNPFREDIEKIIIDKIESLTNKKIDSLYNVQDTLGESWFDIKDTSFQTKIGTELYILDENNPIYINLLYDISQQLDMDFYFQKTATIRAHPYDWDRTYWYHLDTSHFNQHPDQLNVMLPITTEHFYFSLVPKWFTKLIQYITNNDVHKMDKTKFRENHTWFRKICRWLAKDYYTLDDILIWGSNDHLHCALPRNNTNRFSFDMRILPMEHDTSYKWDNSIFNYRRGDFTYKPGDFFSSKTIRETINN
tara:strand:+ start:86 stop:844 length:759 start_codon:yes stop_codon:yes gene_type:complete